MPVSVCVKAKEDFPRDFRNHKLSTKSNRIRGLAGRGATKRRTGEVVNLGTSLELGGRSIKSGRYASCDN